MKKRKDFLIFGSPKIGQEEIDEAVDSLKSGWISTGPKVMRFEKEFKRYFGFPYVSAVNSCTAGLHLSLLSANIGPGDEVITTPMTFAATINVIIHVGARPVFADIDKATMNISPSEILKKLSKKTKVIIPVHFAGRPCDMDPIMRIAKDNKLIVIEDAAHALGAEYHGKKIGNFGDFAAFSFYVTKNLVTGEGGMVVTKNKKAQEKIQCLALHGMSKGAWKRYSDKGYKHYQVVYPGYKYAMMDLQAALGIHQLENFSRYQKKRRHIWNIYNEKLKDLPLITPAPPAKNTKHAYHLYTVLLKTENMSIDRDRFVQELYKRNIGTGIHFKSVHLHPYYKKRFGYRRGDFPVSEWVSNRTISLPLSAKITDSDINYVVRAIYEIVDKYHI